MRLPPGLRIELVAAEPDVLDPVAIAFDENGRLFVAEMLDYPNEPATGKPLRSSIRLLQDKDGDGRYETAQFFAQGLPFCNGVLPWRGGVIATLAGEVAYFADDDGDGKADRRESWFTGFKAENSQLRANHPTLGLDNYVYVANGLRGGSVIAAHEPWRNAGAEPLSISGLDFRFDPRTGEYDAVSGNGQFGLTFDDFGNRFVCSNRNPCMQVMLENRYIKRNPLLALPRVVHDVSPAAEASHLYPLSRAWTTSNMHASQFTAACGVTIYRGDALPPEYFGNSFTCDPTGNLVHRDVLEAHGAAFDAQANTAKTEFLATPDEWFRPVNLANGPDGALYVVAMYRPVIEHPDFMPNELKQRPENFRSGERGRVYRIVATKDHADGNQPRAVRQSPNLSKATLADLVGLLERSGSWWRETAARLLLERGDQAAVPQLRELLTASRSPQARVHSLWLLRGLNQLQPENVLTALSDADPRVQAHAVQLAEPWLNSRADIRRRVVRLFGADDARLRFQVALSLGEFVRPQKMDDEEDLVTAALADIAVHDAADRWTRAAVGSSLNGRAATVLQIVLRAKLNAARPGLSDLTNELSQMVGSQQNVAEIAAVVEGIAPLLPPFGTGVYGSDQAADQLDLALASVRGLGLGVGRRGKSLASFKAQLSEANRRTLDDLFARAVALAAASGADVQRRTEAERILSYADFAAAGKTLLDLSADKKEPIVRLAAIETLARFDDPAIGPALLREFSRDTPAVRRAIVASMLSDRQRTSLLFDEMSAGRISVTELQPDEWRRLVAHKDLELQRRAKQLQAASAPADRQEVLEKYRKALELASDPGRGKEVFAKNCAACHRVAGVGVDLGPNISDSLGKTPEYYLLNILDPNRAVDNRYFSYTLTLTDGRVLTGIIDAETASSVTVRQQENKFTTILREDIDEMRSNGISFMPVGFEKNISEQQMMDVISFLKSWRYLEENAAVRP
jgi:putative membrane-bound dehydrogenase-like protein